MWFARHDRLDAGGVLSPPDLRRWRESRTGVPYVHRFEGHQPGPTAMIVALTHGNELCGAHALDCLLRAGVPMRRGTLLLAFANIAAFERFDARQPLAARCVEEDLNRVWSDVVLQGPRESVELGRARALLPFVEAADVLLDLHSMQEPDAEALTICGVTDKSVPLARALGQPGTLMVDTGHHAGVRLIDRGGFADASSPRQAMLVECGPHWAPASADMALDLCVRLLRHLGLVDARWELPRRPCPTPLRQRLLRVTEAVTARSPAFRFVTPPQHLGVIPKAGTLLAEDGEQRWLTPFDDCVLVMPSQREGVPGQTMVRLGRYED